MFEKHSIEQLLNRINEIDAQEIDEVKWRSVTPAELDELMRGGYVLRVKQNGSWNAEDIVISIYSKDQKIVMVRPWIDYAFADRNDICADVGVYEVVS